jgi:hypothetical protein
MNISCSPAVVADFDRALALLHNFWYVRALERFNQILKNDPYGLSILGAVPEGSRGFAQPEQAAKLFEAVYAHHPDHPGALHYIIHAYDDPEHAQQGLKAARAYAQAAAAVPP